MCIAFPLSDELSKAPIRQYLGKTVTLGTKKCGPGECFVGTFYTINLAEGLFVFKDGLFLLLIKTSEFVIQSSSLPLSLSLSCE